MVYYLLCVERFAVHPLSFAHLSDDVDLSLSSLDVHEAFTQVVHEGPFVHATMCLDESSLTMCLVLVIYFTAVFSFFDVSLDL